MVSPGYLLGCWTNLVHGCWPAFIRPARITQAMLVAGIGRRAGANDLYGCAIGGLSHFFPSPLIDQLVLGSNNYLIFNLFKLHGLDRKPTYYNLGLLFEGILFWWFCSGTKRNTEAILGRGVQSTATCWTLVSTCDSRCFVCEEANHCSPQAKKHPDAN